MVWGGRARNFLRDRISRSQRTGFLAGGLKADRLERLTDSTKQ
jgi:hypothetical protein